MGILHCRRRVLSMLVLCAVAVASLACFATMPPAATHCAQQMPCCPAPNPASGASHSCCDVERNTPLTFTAAREPVQLQPASVPDRSTGLRQRSPVPASGLDTSFHPAVFQLKVDLRI